MDTLLRDIRYGCRMLLRTPGFTLVAVATLALGIGANTTIFSLIDAVLLRPWPFLQSDQLVAVHTTEVREHVQFGSASYPDFLDWRAQNRSFQDLAAYTTDHMTLTGRGDAVQLNTVTASAGLFSLLGASPAQGRRFTPQEDQAGAPLLVIVSHRFWESRLASDPSIVGKAITLNSRPYTVVGVMPAGFNFPIGAAAIDLWTTMARDLTPINASDTPMGVQRGAHYLDVIGRLKSGVSLQSAQVDLGTIQSAINQQHPENRPKGINVIPEVDRLVGETRRALLILFGAVGLVLMIACANVANLLLARTNARHKEITVRVAVGARRSEIVRQLLTESVLLSLAGTVPGIVLAIFGIDLCTSLVSDKLPRISESGLNFQVLGFTALVAMITGIAFGLVPALQASRLDLNRSLNEGGRSGSDSTRRSRVRDALIVSEVGIAMVLLVGAGLLFQNLFRLSRLNPGFSADHAITFGLEPSGLRYSDDQRTRLYRDLVAEIKTVPGVRSASAVFPLPLSHNGVGTSLEIAGVPAPVRQRPAISVSLAAPGYFETMGIPLLRGRLFNEHDDAQSAPVAIVNQALAERCFPGENPIGKRVRPSVWHDQGDGPMFEIVGVVADVKQEKLPGPSRPMLYQPDAQDPFGQLSLIVRTAVSPESIVPSLREKVRVLDKDLPLVDVKTLDEYVSDSLSQSRFQTILLVSFAVLALILTAVGLYGVISYSVSQRNHEIGVRLALGAQRSDILRLVVRQGMVLSLVGVGFGLIASFGVTRVMSTLLVEIHATDPATFLVIPALLMAVALAASYIPARKAMNVDPVLALRYE